jgi:hypothetical protein
MMHRRGIRYTAMPTDGHGRLGRISKLLIMKGLHSRPSGHATCFSLRQEDRMELMAQVATAVGGLAVAFGASRLVLEGVLAVTFGRRRG